ncbi:MAG: hypothetical protein JST54_25580 [Deltaproteobacteria bacterium]|nr:hypothetical protein [Deltaproteobacteria bacterium]
MMKAFGIAALLAGALPILPSTAHADPGCERRERVERDHWRFERDRELMERLHMRRASFEAEQRFRRDQFARSWGWDRRRMAGFDGQEAIERARFEDGLRRSWWIQHERIEHEGPRGWN